MNPNQAHELHPAARAKKEDGAYKPSVLRTVRRGFASLPKAARAALLALTVATGAGTAGVAHHVTGFEVPGPIPVAGIADTVESDVAGFVLGVKQKQEFDQYENSMQAHARNASDGAFYVSREIVSGFTDQNGSHIVSIGGAAVTPDAQGYTIYNPALLLPNSLRSTDGSLPSTGQPGAPEIVALVTYADGTSGYVGIGVGDDDLLGAVGTGNPDIRVARQATHIGAINSDGTISMPEGSGAMPTTADGLSQAVPTAAAPTLQP